MVNARVIAIIIALPFAPILPIIVDAVHVHRIVPLNAPEHAAQDAQPNAQNPAELGVLLNVQNHVAVAVPLNVPSHVALVVLLNAPNRAVLVVPQGVKGVVLWHAQVIALETATTLALEDAKANADQHAEVLAMKNA